MASLKNETSSEATAEKAVRLHRAYGGKMQTIAKCPVRGLEDFAIWYTPGVAAASQAVAADPDQVFELTNKGNTVAIVSDGSRVLGLGNIGPSAGLPVMEGKALLFKLLGGVDAIPLCIDVHGTDEIISFVRAIAPTFGGINLEDISQPKCFRVLDALRSGLDMPVWHDDQQGTALVVLAGLLNALEIVGRDLKTVRIALVGIGAANMAVYRMLKAEGVDPVQIIACDSKGMLHRNREDIKESQDLFIEKWQVCTETNPECRNGDVAAALSGTHVCLAFSQPGPNVIPAKAVSAMAENPIVFACANPVPEIWPSVALEAGAKIMATGRSDFPNQVNNSLAFPGLFRGALDIRARMITDGMVRAGAAALAEHARVEGLSETTILPRTDKVEVAAEVAAATAIAAQHGGVAHREAARSDLYQKALHRIRNARAMEDALYDEGFIADPDTFAE